jgi:hypothetical protein
MNMMIVISSIKSKNPKKYFFMLKNADYLFASCIHLFLQEMRSKAIDIIFKVSFELILLFKKKKITIKVSN